MKIEGLVIQFFYPVATCATEEVRRLSGMIYYFKKYMAYFSKKAALLYELIKKNSYSRNSSNSSVTWN